MTDISISLPAKRRRGRPRKDGNLSREPTLRSPENPTPINHIQWIGPTYPSSDGLNNNAHEINRSPKDAAIDGVIGSVIYGVIEGSFDAGYLISVRIGNNDTPLRGVVFQPKKFIPVTAANDIAPQAKVYLRSEIKVPFSDNLSPISGFSPHFRQQPVPATKQMVMRPVLPSMPTYFSNQPTFMLSENTMMSRASSLSDMGGKITVLRTPTNQHSPPVHPADMAATSSLPGKESTNQNSQVHGKFVESAFGPSTFPQQGSNVEFQHNFMEDMSRPAFDIQRGEMVRREMEHQREFVVHSLPVESRDIKTDLQTTGMYYNDNPRGPDFNFHHSLFANQSHPNSREPARLGPEFHQSNLVDIVPKSPNLKLDLSSAVHEMKSPNYSIHNEMRSPNYSIHNEMRSPNYSIHNETKSPNLGYHRALVAGNPLLLPPEFTGEPLEFMLEKNKSVHNSNATQETSNEVASSPSGPYKLELATPQSTVNARTGEQTNNSSAGCITDMDFVLSDVVQPTERHEHLRDLSETKYR